MKNKRYHYTSNKIYKDNFSFIQVKEPSCGTFRKQLDTVTQCLDYNLRHLCAVLQEAVICKNPLIKQEFLTPNSTL